MKIIRNIILIIGLLFLTSCKEKIYKIDFLSDGSLIESQEVSTFEEIIFPSDPVKDGYTFLGWDKDISKITSDLEVNALFEINRYKAIFLVDGSIIETQTIEHGKEATLPVEPTKEGYIFRGWDKEVGSMISDLEINAIFEKKEYIVEFLVDGNIVEKQIVKFKESANPQNPKKVDYDFIGWSEDFEEVTSDMKIDAIFKKKASKQVEEVIDEINGYFEKLTLPLCESNLQLHTGNENVTVVWTSNNEEVINLKGEVKSPLTEKKYITVILKATVKCEEITKTVAYNFTVKRGHKNLDNGINAVYNSLSIMSSVALDTYDIVYCSFLYISNDTTGNLKGAANVITKTNGYKDELHKRGGRLIPSLAVQSSTDISNLKVIIEDDEKLDFLVNNLLKFCKENDFDGIDIDWETPGTNGGNYYTKFIKKIYEAFKKENPNYLITSAIGAGPWQYKRYNLLDNGKYHDYINMMSYGMQSSTVSTFQNALYYKKGACLTQCSIDWSIKAYEEVGIKRKQIIIGVPFYGRVFSDTSGLAKSASGNVAVGKSIIDGYIKSGVYNEYFDEDCNVPYLYNEAEKKFVTYENGKSIIIKWKYIKENGLAGMMAWNYRQDSNDELTIAMKNGKNTYMN